MRQLSAPVTWKQFVALPDDDRRELVDGQLIEYDMPTKLHENIIALMLMWLSTWALKNGHRVLGSGYKVRINDKNGAMPDIQMFTDAEWRKAPNEALEHGRPTLAVEVISPTSKAHDRVRKLNWYAKIGVPEYWIVDGEAQTLERLTLAKGHYVHRQVASGADVFRPTRFKGLKIPLAQLWDI